MGSGAGDTSVFVMRYRMAQKSMTKRAALYHRERVFDPMLGRWVVEDQ